MCRSYSAFDDDDGSSEQPEVAVTGVNFAFLGAGGTTIPALLALSGRRKFLNLVLN